MLWVAFMIDKENVSEIRDKYLAAHREYLDSNADKIFFTGPLMADDGSHNNGSMWILNVTSRAEAEAFVANEPYVQQGVFANIRVSRTRPGRFFPKRVE